METKKKHTFFSEGPINPQSITDSIASHARKKNIGAHQIFMGQVRADVIDGKTVSAIEYSAYNEMAEKELERIRENCIVKHSLTCAHVKHSLGKVNTGEICFFVFVSSPHRQAAFNACEEMVNTIKKEVPIFGKEIFEDESHQWKTNK
jgi:molybdopterin synthase catalytic subunit